MEQKKQNTNQTTEHLNDISQALAAIYSGVFFIDLRTDTYQIINAPSFIVEMLAGITSAQQAIYLAVQKTVSQNELLDMISFVNLTTLPSRMQGERFLNTEYKGTLSGWVRGSFIEVKQDEEGKLSQVLYTYQIIDEEKRKELECLQQLKDSYTRTEKQNLERNALLEADKKELADDLDYHNNFTRITMEQLDCGVLVYTVPGRNILQINKAAMRICGWKSKEEVATCLTKYWGEMRLENYEDKEKTAAVEKNRRVRKISFYDCIRYGERKEGTRRE